MPTYEAAKKLNDVYRSWKLQEKPYAFHPVKTILERISGKWSMIILVTLAMRPYRFGELMREIPGISQRVLTKALTDLQRDGLINRTVYATKPPSVEYELTSLGASLMLPLWEIVHWATVNTDIIKSVRNQFDMQGRNNQPLGNFNTKTSDE